MLLEARFADTRSPDLFMQCSPDPRSHRFHGNDALHLPAVLREIRS
jgi:hypothetical protein